VSARAEPKKAIVGHREQQRQETMRLIKASALKLFEDRGFDATTTKQIADEAGVAHGTVFLVAPTKDALLVTVLEDELGEVMKEIDASMPRRPIEAQIRHVCDALFDFHARRPNLSRVFMKAVMFFSAPIAMAQYEEHVSAFVRYLAGLFDDAKSRGELAAGANTAVAADNTVALYIHLLVSFLNEPKPDRRALEAKFRAGLGLLFQGLPASRSRPGKGRGRRSTA
jgi:AcrR family transcriptional regulator